MFVLDRLVTAFLTAVQQQHHAPCCAGVVGSRQSRLALIPEVIHELMLPWVRRTRAAGRISRSCDGTAHGGHVRSAQRRHFPAADPSLTEAASNGK
jgi:hypothetical protein